MDSRSTPISQINPEFGQEGDDSTLSADILREMQMSQEQPPAIPPQQPMMHQQTPQQHQENYEEMNDEEEQEMTEEEMNAYMEENAALARQYVMKEVIVLVIAFSLLQMPQVIDAIQKLLTKYLTRLSSKSVGYVDIFVRALVLAVVFVLVREFVL